MGGDQTTRTQASTKFPPSPMGITQTPSHLRPPVVIQDQHLADGACRYAGDDAPSWLQPWRASFLLLQSCMRLLAGRLRQEATEA